MNFELMISMCVSAEFYSPEFSDLLLLFSAVLRCVALFLRQVNSQKALEVMLLSSPKSQEKASWISFLI